MTARLDWSLKKMFSLMRLTMYVNRRSYADFARASREYAACSRRSGVATSLPPLDESLIVRNVSAFPSASGGHEKHLAALARSGAAGEADRKGSENAQHAVARIGR